MKLRISNNSIRFRLDLPEVDTLKQNGLLEEKISLPNHTLRYAVECNATASPLSIAFNDDRIVAGIHPDDIVRLADTDIITIESSIETEPSRFVKVYVEKDLASLPAKLKKHSGD